MNIPHGSTSIWSCHFPYLGIYFLSRLCLESSSIHNVYMYKFYNLHHLFFLSSLCLSIITGAAGMLNHHSLNLRVHLSVFDFLRGEYLVKSSKKTSMIIYRDGKNAKSNAMTRRALANFSVAWMHEMLVSSTNKTLEFVNYLKYSLNKFNRIKTIKADTPAQGVMELGTGL